MVRCSICNYTAKSSLQAHINRVHGLNNAQYIEKCLGSKIYSDEYCKEHADKVKVFTTSPEYRKKMSESTKALWSDDAYRNKTCSALRVGQSSEEARANHSVGAKKHFDSRTQEQANEHNRSIKESWKDATKRNNRVDALRKAHRSPDSRKNHSEATKKFYAGLSARKRKAIRNNLKRAWSKPELRKKILELSKIGLKKANSPESREKIRLTNLSPETKERRRLSTARRLAKMPTVSSLNKIFRRALHKAGLFPKEEYRIDYYVVDFCFPKKKIVIEVDGNYWHGNPTYYSTFNKTQRRVVGKDKAEGTYLRNREWTLLRFWEDDINKHLGSCVEKVVGALNESRR